MPGGHHGKDPDHPDQADAHSGDHGGHQRIPHAPQAAADDLHRHIDPVPGRHQRHQPHAQRQHLCVIGKKIEEIAPAGHEEQAPQYGHGQRHPHAELQAAFDSVIEPGSVVLAHKGHDGDAESVEDEPVHRIQLAHGHPGCDGIGAEAVDGGGDDHVGHRVKHRLQAAGQADAHRPAEHPPVGPELFQVQPEGPGAAREHRTDQQGADKLGKGSGYRHPGHAHGKHLHEQQVQPHVHKAADNENIQGPPGIPHGPENGRAHVVDHAGDHGKIYKAKVQGRVGHGVLRRAHQAQHKGGGGKAKHRHQRPAEGGEDEGRVHRLGKVLLLPGPEILGDDHRRPGGQAREKADEQIQDLG